MSRTTYFNAFNCRPSYGQVQDTSGSTTVVSGGAVDETVICTAGETISVRDIVYVYTDGLAYRASAVDVQIVSASFEIGFAVSGVLSGSTFPVETRLGKVLDGFSGLSVGKRYFLSESAGLISAAPPDAGGSIVYQVGIAKGSDKLLFKPQLLVRKFDP